MNTYTITHQYLGITNWPEYYVQAKSLTEARKQFHKDFGVTCGISNHGCKIITIVKI